MKKVLLSGRFRSPSGEEVETMEINGVLAVKFHDCDEFVEFMGCIDHWWVAGYKDFNILPTAKGMYISSGPDLSVQGVLYQRM